MKKLLMVILIATVITGVLNLSYAGDDEWATAGKVLAIVEGVRIFAPLKLTDYTQIRIGMDMEVVIEKLWQEDDKEVIGYKFMPV